MSQQVNADIVQHFFRATTEDFRKVPGSPVAYWLGKNTFNAFNKNKALGKYARAAKGLVTANNDAFVREWTEVDYKK